MDAQMHRRTHTSTHAFAHKYARTHACTHARKDADVNANAQILPKHNPDSEMRTRWRQWERHRHTWIDACVCTHVCMRAGPLQIAFNNFLRDNAVASVVRHACTPALCASAFAHRGRKLLVCSAASQSTVEYSILAFELQRVMLGVRGEATNYLLITRMS